MLLADDNLLVREGVRALLATEPDIEVVGVAADLAELLDRVAQTRPTVLVTDIRMPPTFQQEGIEAAKEVRHRHPGTGVVVLSQFDDPEYAVTLLGEGAAGYAYLLKDRVAEGGALADAVRAVATGGSMLDPHIVDALVAPVTVDGDLSAEDEQLLAQVAAGKPIKAIAVGQQTTPSAVADAVERLFLKLAEGATRGSAVALRRLRMLHQAIVDREEQGESLSRLLPTGVAERVRAGGQRIGETERLVVTVVMSDIRGYSGIAEHSDPSVLAAQLNEHRAAMNVAILGHGGTVMQFVGDAVMAVFGAPVACEEHAARAVEAAHDMHAAQAVIDIGWRERGLAPFGLGIGISTGEVAAALLGSEDRLEYSVVGDAVNLAQRLQQWADVGETVISDETMAALDGALDAAPIEPALVKGRTQPVRAFRIAAASATTPTPGGAR